MPDSPSKLPLRPSLEQLKKQAKERLETMPGATLAEAQFALARHYGFESWAKLKHHVEALPPAGLEQHEGLARDLVAVYRHDDAAAAERLNDLFHSALNTEQIRQFIKDRLITNAGMRHLVRLPALREVRLEYNRNITRTGASVFPSRVRVKYEAR